MASRPLSGRSVHGHAGRIFWCDAREAAADPALPATVVTGCEDGTVGVWTDGTNSSAPKGWSFTAHTEEALRVAWEQGPTDGLVYSGGSDGTVKAWRIDLEEERSTAIFQASVLSKAGDEGQVYSLIQFSSNTTELAVAHDNCVTVLDKPNFAELCAWRYHPLGDISVGGARNPLGRCFVFDATTHGEMVVAALSDGSIRLRDLRSPLRDIAAVAVHSAYATCCAVSPSGNIIVSGNGQGGVKAMDIRTFGELLSHDPPAGKPGAPKFGAGFWPGTEETFFSWSGDGSMILHRDNVQCPIDVDIRSRKRGQNYPVYCAKASIHGHKLYVSGGQAPEENALPSRTGLPPTPSLAQGCLRVNESPGESLNPWLSVDLSSGMVEEFLANAANTASGN
eukprot:CAMPEP_0184507126 /NCGR_PEP_ID=MMETSP0198_2-20121128/80_1 /TAXON_ID=1112570 /ORGANISM="Thraustochytrium sp., Strain LLF1b" /LENGTH=393 /DNA_ID=CAMNT_0026896861 /DNA_START=1 /DNA_END=1182 /DNA_ORIENTATION=+